MVAWRGGDEPPAQGPPFPHPSCSSERKESVKGARFLRGLRTLDRFFPFWNIDPEGKGAGGLRGLVPLAEYEAAPHARPWRAGPRSLCTAGRRLGAPTARAALEHVAVMQDAVEHGGDRCHITQQFAPVFDWTI